MRLGEESGLDLVEVNPEAQPPVCRLMDYGKLKYQQKKKTHQKRKTQPQQKEIRITPKIGEHDLQVKMRQAYGFLQDGDKVLVSMTFRGREVVHMERAKEIMVRIVNELAEVGKVEKDAKQEGRRLMMVIAPGGSPKKSESSTKTDSPKSEASKVDGPKAEIPKAEMPKLETPKVEIPKPEALPRDTQGKAEGQQINAAPSNATPKQ